MWKGSETELLRKLDTVECYSDLKVHVGFEVPFLNRPKHDDCVGRLGK